MRIKAAYTSGKGGGFLRLGLVLTGTGAHAAAGIGVLEELALRGMEPWAVCGMHAGAWPAALHIAGYDAADIAKAALRVARMGGRLFGVPVSARALLGGKKAALLQGRRLDMLLAAQASERSIGLCPRQGLFICRCAPSGRRVIFATQAYDQEPGAVLNMQASVGFAARAAMSLPPFLEPMQWLGAPLLPEGDVNAAAAQLLAMGAQRVLIAQPFARRQMDALQLCSLCAQTQARQDARLGVLHIPIADGVSAMDAARAEACLLAGRRAAEDALDGALLRLGMAPCRVLPFRRKTV